MDKELKKVFNNAKYNANTNLSENIWLKLLIHQKRIYQFKLWSFSFIGITSLIVLFPTIKMLLNDLTQSGFYEYFSLVFSNNESILFYWKELTLSLAESIPTLSIILTLSLIFICLISLKQLVKQIINNQSFTQGSPV